MPASQVSVLRRRDDHPAVSLEEVPPLGDEVLHGRRRAVADDLDQVVRALEGCPRSRSRCTVAVPVVPVAPVIRNSR
jgi:hypothetical protein